MKRSLRRGQGKGLARRLTMEPLEVRTVLAPVTALPFSLILTKPPFSSTEPPDPCIQFNPQPVVSAGLSNAPFTWQGRFSEILKEPSGSAAPARWLVDVVYDLSGQPTAVAIPQFIIQGGQPAWDYAYNLTGTVTETLTPADAAGHAVALAQAWSCTDTIASSHTFISRSMLPHVGNTFSFTTATTFTQVLQPAATAAPATTTPSLTWNGNTTVDTTGTIKESSSAASGSLSFKEKIGQNLTPSSQPQIVGLAWAIQAELDGSGTFRDTLSTASQDGTVSAPEGTMTINGRLKGTIVNPTVAPHKPLPSETFDTSVTAKITWSPPKP